MPTRGSKDPNGRALRGRRAHTTFALLKGPLLTDPARQIWDSFNNRANAGGADAPEAAVDGCLYDRFKSLYNKTATKPSLVIVPARFKSGTLYSQIPSSNADFTVTRNTEARRFNSAGLIESVASGIPRLDYYTSGGVTGCPALLVEPSAQNLILQSQFGAGWFAAASAQVTVNTTGTLDPLGTNTAARLFCRAAPSGSAEQGFFRTGVNLSSGVHTISVFAKKANNFDWIRLTFLEAGGVALHNAYFNLLSGTVGTVSSGSTATIQNYGNGWYRIMQSRSIVSGTNCGIRVNLASANNTASVTVDGDSGSYIWGAQVETGSVATSYIPTTTGSVTRAADVISVSGAVSGSIGQTEGTIYAEVDLRNIADTKTIIQSDDGTADNRLILFVGTAPNRIQFLTVASGTNSVVSGSIATGINKIAASYFSGSVQLYLNGSFLASGTPTAFPTVTRNNFSLGTRISAGVYGAQFNDRIRAAALYTTRLTNAELATLTQP